MKNQHSYIMNILILVSICCSLLGMDTAVKPELAQSNVDDEKRSKEHFEQAGAKPQRQGEIEYEASEEKAVVYRGTSDSSDSESHGDDDAWKVDAINKAIRNDYYGEEESDGSEVATKNTPSAQKIRKQLLDIRVLDYDVQPFFTVLKKRKAGTPNQNIQDVVKIIQYLVAKELQHPVQERHIAKFIGQSPGKKGCVVDATKLNKLLYLIQGYALAIEGKSFFSAKFVAGKAGPRISEVSQWLEIHKKNSTSVLNDDGDSLSTAQKNHIDAVHRLPGEFLQKMFDDLGEKTTVLVEESMKKIFLDPALWSEYIVARLCTAVISEDRNNIITYIREYLSYCCFTGDAITSIHTIFEKRLSILSEERLEKWLSDFERNVTWPEQNYFEGLMGFLFFPIQYGTKHGIDFGEQFEYSMAIAASYNSLLAIQIMADSFADYKQFNFTEDFLLEDGFEDESFDYEAFDGGMDDYYPTNVEKYIRNGSKKIEWIRSYTEKLSNKENLPYYYCGLLCKKDIEAIEPSEYYKKGYEISKSGRGTKKFPFSLYEYLRDPDGKLNKEEKKEGMEELKKVDRGLAMMLEAKDCSSDQQYILLFEEAGNLGVPQGYNCAARLCERCGDEVRAYKNYARAVQHHIRSAYDDMAELLIRASKRSEKPAKKIYREKAKELYYLAGKLGSVHSYLEYKKLLFEERDYDKIFESRKKARIDKPENNKHISGLELLVKDLKEMHCASNPERHRNSQAELNGQTPSKKIKSGSVHKQPSYIQAIAATLSKEAVFQVFKANEKNSRK